MSVVSLDNFRHETRLAIRISTRDVAKRLAGLGMVLALCWATGSRLSVLATVVLVLLCELSAQLVALREPPPDRELPLRLAIWMWLTNIPSTLIFLIPSAILATRPETPLVLAGFLWLFGVYVHISNLFVMLPLYNWCQMVPAFAAGLIMVALAAARPDGGNDAWLWACVAGLFVTYSINTVGTMTTQKEFHRELSRARAEARARLVALERASRIDILTGLLNRQAFDAALAGMIREAGPGREVAVLSVDLDGFKPLNDTYGHAAGDAVLAATGRRMAALAAAEGVAGRLGGDEMALAVPGLRSARAAMDLGLRLAREVERAVLHEGKALRVGGSVGVALSGPDSRPGGAGANGGDPDRAGETPADRLLAASDRAMLLAKATARLGGESRPVLHDPRSDPPRPRPDDRHCLAGALAAGAITPRYLPIRDLATGALAGFEACAAWGLEDRMRGAGDHRPPPTGREASRADDEGQDLTDERAALLARAAELGLQGDMLVSITEAVLRDLDGLIAEGLDPGCIAVPVPEMALATRNGRRDLDRLLAAHPLARGRVSLGLPADVLTTRAGDRVRDGVAHLRAMGARIAIHGFGTGQACFRHLWQAPFDELRLDASYVGQLGRDPAVQVAVDALAVIARGLGARLVAEGVATEEQRRVLLGVGCQLGSGPIFGAPLDASAMRRAVLEAMEVSETAMGAMAS